MNDLPIFNSVIIAIFETTKMNNMKYLFTLVFCMPFFIAQAQQYTIKKLGLEKKLSNSYILDIAEDKTGYLWFATEDGLNKLERGVFTPF